MNITRSGKLTKEVYKECEFMGCTNKFYGSPNRKYCRDSRCKERRKAEYNRSYKPPVCKEVSNTIINRNKYENKLETGQRLTIRCHARDKNGKRCKNTFIILYSKRQQVYPKYCKDHRSAYKRKLFNKKGII